MKFLKCVGKISDFSALAVNVYQVAKEGLVHIFGRNSLK